MKSFPTEFEKSLSLFPREVDQAVSGSIKGELICPKKPPKLDLDSGISAGNRKHFQEIIYEASVTFISNSSEESFIRPKVVIPKMAPKNEPQYLVILMKISNWTFSANRLFPLVAKF